MINEYCEYCVNLCVQLRFVACFSACLVVSFGAFDACEVSNCSRMSEHQINGSFCLSEMCFSSNLSSSLSALYECALVTMHALVWTSGCMWVWWCVKASLKAESHSVNEHCPLAGPKSLLITRGEWEQRECVKCQIFSGASHRHTPFKC